VNISCLPSCSVYSGFITLSILPGAPYTGYVCGAFDLPLRRVAHPYGSASPGRRHSRNPFNPQPLISHLTNSNECGNLQVKVLLTVSPLRPFLPPQPHVSPRAPHSLLPIHLRSVSSAPPWQIPSFHQLSALCSRHSPLATSPLFSVLCSLFGAPKKVNSFAIKQIQTLFAKYRGGVGIPSATTGHPGCGVPPPARSGAFVPRASAFNNSLWNQHLQKCNKTKDFKYVHNQHLCKNRGGGGASSSLRQGSSGPLDPVRPPVYPGAVCAWPLPVCSPLVYPERRLRRATSRYPFRYPCTRRLLRRAASLATIGRTHRIAFRALPVSLLHRCKQAWRPSTGKNSIVSSAANSS
jgi:hypothetical protein